MGATGVEESFAAGMSRLAQLIALACYEQADEALDGLRRSAGSDDERVAAAVGQANLRFWHRADEVGALRPLDELAGTLTDGPAAEELAVQRAALWLYGGRTVRAQAVGRGVRRRERGSPAVLQLATAVEVLAAGVRGTVVSGIAALPDPDGDPAPVRYGVVAMSVGLARAVNGLDVAVHVPDGRLGACERSAAVVDGTRLLWAGRPQRARAALEWAVEGLRGHRMLSWALGELAYCRALLGDADGAAAAAEAAGMAHNPCSHVDEFAVGRGRAWAAAARGEVASARVLIAATAGACQRFGQPALAAQAWYDLARFGDPERAAPALRQLAGGGRGAAAAGRTTGFPTGRPTASPTGSGLGLPDGADETVAEALAAHVAAIVAGDAVALALVSARARQRGHLLHAAEAAADAAAAFGARRRRDRDRWAATARELAASCEGARTPPLARVQALDLTPRELEVAALAGRGLSNRDIAARLELSVRTVANHLQACYDKLDVHGRDGLRHLHAAGVEGPVAAG